MVMDERTDPELVKASLDGNRTAFEELVCRHQDSVFGLAVGMTRNREDAADMAQEAFILKNAVKSFSNEQELGSIGDGKQMHVFEEVLKSPF